ncbi:MAG: class II glutamine amidotransferase [Geminicoccales bacterium]
MCRLAAYTGPEIPLENIIVTPRHSLLEQSHGATEAKLAVNGDGFGISWYGHGEKPGQYRDVLPAWSDGNLTSICRMVHSPIFLAHVRASTVGETSRVNCHPFVYENWSFMHNGQVPSFSRIRRQLEVTLPDDLYNARRGTTDSELLFLLLLANGLASDPKRAFESIISMIRLAQGKIDRPNRIACVFSDGKKLYACRHSCDKHSPTLYVSGELDAQGRAFASEPLDSCQQNWSSIVEDQFACLSAGEFASEPLMID